MNTTLENWTGTSEIARTTLVLVFTDIVNSTALGIELGDEEWIELLVKHFAQARKLLSKYDCYEIKIIGDSFMVVFRTAVDALNFSLAFHAETGDEHIRIRAGIHVGQVRIMDNDIYGSMVNYTFRVTGWLEDDGVALSNTAKENITQVLGQRSSLRFVDHTTRLKGFHETQKLWRVWKIKVIAVLPFEVPANTSALGVQFADALIIKLNKIEEIIVRPTSSVQKYADLEIDPLEAGREQEADFVVAGKIELAGGEMRVRARLLRVRDGEELWTERYEENTRDTSDMEVSISKQIVRKLKLKPTKKERERLAKRHTQSPEAYEEYKWGRYFRSKFTEDSLNKAIEHFKKAIELDRSYGKAYAGVADCYIWLGIYNFPPPGETFAQVKIWANDALKIDSTLASAHTALAFTNMFYEWDWASAEREFKSALEINPNFATAHQGYSLWLTAKGRFQDALAEIEQALEVAPTSFIINVSKGLTLYAAQQYDKSLEQFKKVVEFNPDFDAGYYGLALAYEQNEMYEEAIAAAEKAYEHSQHHPIKLAARAHIYAMSGMKKEALWELEKLNRLRRRRYISPFHIAILYDAIGETDQAFKSLGEAYDERDPWLFLLCVEPRIMRLSKDERFKNLLAEIGLQNCPETSD
jgi:class 3 adenylate cyclase/tetratricopeptide (TPR) repeat protein